MKSNPVSRNEVIAVSTAYLQTGLVSNEFEKLPIADDCIRTENGWYSGKSKGEILGNMPKIPGLGNLRWVVEGQEAVVFWEIFRPVTGRPIAEYFRLVDGQIKEIRATFNNLHATSNALGPAGSHDFERVPKTRGQRDLDTIRAGERFYEGLERGDLAGVPFGSDITITENGEMTAQGHESLSRWHRESFADHVRKVDIRSWVVEGDEAAALFSANLTGGMVIVGTQYFRFYEGLIREIVVSYGGGPSPKEVAFFERGEHVTEKGGEGSTMGAAIEALAEEARGDQGGRHG